MGGPTKNLRTADSKSKVLPSGSGDDHGGGSMDLETGTEIQDSTKEILTRIVACEKSLGVDNDAAAPCMPRIVKLEDMCGISIFGAWNPSLGPTPLSARMDHIERAIFDPQQKWPLENDLQTDLRTAKMESQESMALHAVMQADAERSAVLAESDLGWCGAGTTERRTRLGVKRLVLSLDSGPFLPDMGSLILDARLLLHQTTWHPRHELMDTDQPWRKHDDDAKMWRFVAVGLSNGNVEIWDWRSRASMSCILRIYGQKRCGLTCLSFHGRSLDTLKAVAGTSFRQILVWRPSATPRSDGTLKEVQVPIVEVGREGPREEDLQACTPGAADRGRVENTTRAKAKRELTERLRRQKIVTLGPSSQTPPDHWSSWSAVALTACQHRVGNAYEFLVDIHREKLESLVRALQAEAQDVFEIPSNKVRSLFPICGTSRTRDTYATSPSRAG